MTTPVRAAVREAPAPLTFPFPEPPAPGAALEVSPGVLWLRMPLPFALDHINLWLLRDGDGWAIVDTGINSDDTRACWERIFAEVMREQPVKRVIVTHFHPDHFGMAGWLTPRFGVELWMTESEYLTAHAAYENHSGFTAESTIRLFREHGLDQARLDALGSRGNAYRRSVSEPPIRFRRMMDGNEIGVGRLTWRVVTGYGHAPEHAALHCAESGVLISGDMVLPRISTNVSVWPTEPEGDPLQLFLRSLDRYAELPAATLVLPSHGLPFRGLRQRVRALHEHHDDRLEELRQACATPKSAAELLPILFRRQLDTHQTFFAMGEAIAHLNHLMHRTVLARTIGADGVLRFSATAA